MRIEGAAGEADIDRVIFPETAHQVLAPADHAYRESSGEAFAIGHHVGAHAEIVLSAAGGEPEADEDFVEDQHDVALGADLPQRFQPRAVGGAIETAGARAVDQRGIGRRVGVGVERLQRIDQHAGDIAPRFEDAERPFRHLGQRIGFVRRDRVSHAGLHVTPPAMIGAGKTNQMRCGRCDSGRAALPASPLRCRTCGTRPRRVPKSRTAARHCRRRRDGRARAPGRAHAPAFRRWRCIPCRSRCQRY